MNCVNDKLDQHMLSFAGRHTLESQEGQQDLARVSNLRGASLASAPLLSEERREKRRKGEEGDGGPKGPEEARGHAHKPWPSAHSLGLWCLPGFLPGLHPWYE